MYSIAIYITFNFGAGQPSLPIKDIIRTCDLNKTGWGTGSPAEYIRVRLRISFSAHKRTIFLGLCLQ